MITEAQVTKVLKSNFKIFCKQLSTKNNDHLFKEIPASYILERIFNFFARALFYEYTDY